MYYPVYIVDTVIYEVIRYFGFFFFACIGLDVLSLGVPQSEYTVND